MLLKSIQRAVQETRHGAPPPVCGFTGLSQIIIAPEQVDALGAGMARTSCPFAAGPSYGQHPRFMLVSYSG